MSWVLALCVLVVSRTLGALRRLTVTLVTRSMKKRDRPASTLLSVSVISVVRSLLVEETTTSALLVASQTGSDLVGRAETCSWVRAEPCVAGDVTEKTCVCG